MNRIFSPHIYEYTLRGRIKGLIIWFFSASCTLALLVLLFNLFISSGMPDFVGEMMTALPKDLTQNFYIDALPDLGDYRVNLGLCLQAVMMIGSVYACYLGISSIITCKSNGTLVFGYSQGLSKPCMVISDYISCATVLLLFNMGIFCLSMWIGLSDNAPELTAIILKSFLTMFVSELVFLAVGMFFSSFMTDISACASFALGFFLVTFALGTLGNYMSMFSFLKVFSPYHYFSPYMFSNFNVQVDTDKLVLSFAEIILLTALTCLKQHKSDITEL